MIETINIKFKPGLPHHKLQIALKAAKAIALVKSQMERIPLPHIKVEGSDRCGSCGCPVADFDKEPCK